MSQNRTIWIHFQAFWYQLHFSLGQGSKLGTIFISLAYCEEGRISRNFSPLSVTSCQQRRPKPASLNTRQNSHAPLSIPSRYCRIKVSLQVLESWPIPCRGSPFSLCWYLPTTYTCLLPPFLYQTISKVPFFCSLTFSQNYSWSIFLHFSNPHQGIPSLRPNFWTL